MSLIMNHDVLESTDSMEAGHGQPQEDKNNGSRHGSDKNGDDVDIEMEDSVYFDVNNMNDDDHEVELMDSAAATVAPHRLLPSRLVIGSTCGSILRTGSYEEAMISGAKRQSAAAAAIATSYVHHHQHHFQQQQHNSNKSSNNNEFSQETTILSSSMGTSAASSLHASFDVSQLDGYYHSKRLGQLHQSQLQQQQSPQQEQQYRPIIFASASWEEHQHHHHHEDSIATSPPPPPPPPPPTRKQSSHTPTSRNSPGHHQHQHAATTKTPARAARLRLMKKTPSGGKLRTPVSAKRKHKCSAGSSGLASTAATTTTTTTTTTLTTVATTTPTLTAKSLHTQHQRQRQSPVLLNQQRSLLLSSAGDKMPVEQRQASDDTSTEAWSGQQQQHSDMPPPLPAAAAASSTTRRDSSIILTTAQTTTPFLKNKPAKVSLGNVTTAASSAAAAQHHHHLLLGTTADDSIDTTNTNNSASSGSSDGGGGGGGEGTTPFRFSSFPASLPRINNMARTAKSTSCAALPPPSCLVGTVRKRMSFGEPLPVYPSQHYQAQQQQQQQQQQQLQQLYHQFSNINDNDMRMMLNRSHDTSISSAPDEGDLYGYSDNEEDDDDHDHDHPHGDINHHLTEDNDERLSNASPIGTPVARTRLNFSSAVSPQAAGAVFAPACASGVASIAASSTSSQHRPNGSLTPLRSHHPADDNNNNTSSTQDHHHLLVLHEHQPQQEAPLHAPQQIIRPGTPTEVKIHFAGGAQCCSPIRGIPEEEDDDGNDDTDLCSSSKASSIIIINVAATNAAARKNETALSTSTCSASSTTSEGGSSCCNSSKKRMRQRRPMPDMTAFDGGDAMTTLAASASLFLPRDRTGGGNHDNTTTTVAPSNASLQLPPPPLSPKLLCPPTPVRTPAWAHYEPSLSVGGAAAGGGGHHSQFKKLGGKFGRQNSLIATKVLATCSPQVLDGRTSLENSILEEEQRSYGSNGGSDQQQQQQQQNGRLSSSTTLPHGKTEDTDVAMSDDNNRGHGQEEGVWLHNGARHGASTAAQAPAIGAVVSMSASFDTLALLGSGTFADVYKVRSKTNGNLYAVKKNRRHFRGKRDREKALAEVRYMQRLQSVCASNVNNRSNKVTSPTSYSLYLLFFYQAWQEDGHFFCQTELCCRDTCRELMDSLRRNWPQAREKYPSLRRLEPPPQSASADSQQHALGRLMPESTIWKIFHDISGGLSHIHAYGLVHHDIKPKNIFFVAHSRFGAMCKIGDFGMAGEIGSSDDGQEGDQKYMAPELLAFSEVKHPSADIFSLGLTLYELASTLSFEVPSDGPRWHELRSGAAKLFDHRHIPSSRDAGLIALVRSMMHPIRDKRPTVDELLRHSKVQHAGMECEGFLRDYIHDLEAFDFRQHEQEQASFYVCSAASARLASTTTEKDDRKPPVGGSQLRNCLSPMNRAVPQVGPMLYSPEVAPS